MIKIKFLILTATIAITFYSCNKSDTPVGENNAGKLAFNFEHFADGQQLVFDEMKYTNAANNKYEITEIQWFISDITLNKNDGSKQVLDQEKFAHYIDTNLPETYQWIIEDEIPPGEYSSIVMTFGIKGEKNTPFMYTDPPESDMLWPMNLGGDDGGYHYMKLNGFWINKENQREPFNFHLGVGQERDADDKIVGFIQNWFQVELSGSSFSLNSNESKSVNLRMNVEKWWDSPNLYNHDEQGGKIMQNQKAMTMGLENGQHVFSVSIIGETTESL